jgi:glycosyltransferase involved in cell wall biosynthesis
MLLPGRCLYTPHAFITMAPHLERHWHATYALIEHCLGRVTRTLICVSDSEVQHAARLGIAKDRLALIPNGIAPFDVDADVVAGPGLRKRLGLPAKAFVIGFVGRLDAQKAPRVLVEAAIDVLGRGHDVHVVVIGAGPQRAELETLASACGVARRFFWLGATPSRDWLPGFDVLAMPSRYEGSSYVLFEALSAGVPVICTPVGGVREAGFTDGVHGFIVPVDDPRGLADRLCRLVADPDLRRAMSRNSRERSAQFSLDNMIDRVEAAYRLACGAVGPSPSAAPSGL